MAMSSLHWSMMQRKHWIIHRIASPSGRNLGESFTFVSALLKDAVVVITSGDGAVV